MKVTSSSSSMPSTYSWQWPTSSSSWWTVRGTSRCCVKLASTSGCCSAAVRPWVMKTIHCTRRCRGCLRGWLRRPYSQWPSGTVSLFYSYLIVATTFLKLRLLKRTIQCVFIISELNVNIKLSLLTVCLPPRWLGLFKQTDMLIGGLVKLAGRHLAWE